MKAQELWAIILKEHMDFIAGLYVRWLDEKEYEDIADYLVAIQKRIPQAIRIRKQPFTVTLRCEDMDLAMHVALKGGYVSLKATPVGKQA